MMIQQPIIPAISNMKNLEKFLLSRLNLCILMDFHISMLQDIITVLHQNDKEVIVHLDLIKGIAADEFGAQYLCQKLQVDGVASTKPKVIEAVKKCKKVSIQRVFLIDSKSLEKSLQLANAIKPDYIEILPALAYSAIARIQMITSIPILCGGLIQTQNDINQCLEAKAKAVTVGDVQLWDLSKNNH